MSTDNKRLRILSEFEYKEIYGLPKFNNEVREVFFAITAKEMNVVESLGAVKSKVYFILQLGYFKVSPTFHSFTFEDVKNDALYIYKTYFKHKNTPTFTGKLWQKNILEQQKQILKLCEYKSYNSRTKQVIKTKLKQLIRIHANHIDVFRELLTHLEIKKIMLPKYPYLQDLIGETISSEQRRLSNIVQKHIRKPITSKLKELLESDGEIYNFT